MKKLGKAIGRSLAPIIVEFPIAAAVLLQLAAISWYWIAGFHAAVLLLTTVPGSLILGLVLAILALFVKRSAARWTPIVALLSSVVAFAVIPYSTANMRLDFRIKKPSMIEIARAAQFEEPGLENAEGDSAKRTGPRPTLYLLPERKKWLAKSGDVYLLQSSCGGYVFFPTFYGIPDGVSGFLYVPNCVAAEDFSGDRFGAYWTDVTALEDNWYWIAGT